MQVPISCLSGTSCEELINLNCDVTNALQTAIEMLDKAAPHERDYQGDKAAWRLAREEHRSRRDRLHSVLHELQELTIAISMGLR